MERFWLIYDHLKRPADFRNAEFHLFKDGIRPVWEDPQNKAGGKWSVRLPKGVASRYWEDILLAIVGEQFDVGYEICGAVVSVRSNEDIISVWNKNADNKEAVDKIRDQIRKFVRLPAAIPIEYKRHEMSLEEGSSYKNPTMVWRPPQRDHNAHAPHNSHGPQHKPHNPNYYKEREGGERGGDFKPPDARAHTTTNFHRDRENNAHGSEGGERVAWKPPNRWSEGAGEGAKDGTGGGWRRR